jgi:hypothetical protein
MHLALRPYVTAGVVLTGVGLTAITSVAPQPRDVPDVTVPVRLTATAPGFVAAILNIPANEIAGLQKLADALAENGSIWVFGPQNLLGWDEGDFDFGSSLVAVLVPFPALAEPLAEELNKLLFTELPPAPSPEVGCQGIPVPCPDPIGQLFSQLQVPLWQLIASGEFDPVAPFGEFIERLGQPATLEPLPSIQSVATAVVGVTKGLVTFSNPLAPGSAISPQLLGEWIDAISGWTHRYLIDPITSEFPSFDPLPVTTIPSLSRSAAYRLAPDTLALSAFDGSEPNGVAGTNDIVDGTITAAGQQDPDGVRTTGNASRPLDSLSRSFTADKDSNILNAVLKGREPTGNQSNVDIRSNNETVPLQASGVSAGPDRALAKAARTVGERMSSSLAKIAGGIKKTALDNQPEPQAKTHGVGDASD